MITRYVHAQYLATLYYYFFLLSPTLLQQYVTYTELYDLVSEVSSGLSQLGLNTETRFNIYAATWYVFENNGAVKMIVALTGNPLSCLHPAAHISPSFSVA